MKILTVEEHNDYVHLCGKTGAEVENDLSLCNKCKTFYKCLKSHMVKSIDDAPESMRNIVIDRLEDRIKFFYGKQCKYCGRAWTEDEINNTGWGIWFIEPEIIHCPDCFDKFLEELKEEKE